MHFKRVVGRSCCSRSQLAERDDRSPSAVAAAITACAGPRPTRSKGTSISAGWHSARRMADTAADGASTTRAPTRTCRSVCPSSRTLRSISTSTARPDYVVIQATEPELFKCPFLMVTNHGRAFFTPEEVEALRAYLKKGGFLWADDAWGSYAWDHWLERAAKNPAGRRLSAGRSADQPRDLPHAVRGEAHPADPEHRVLPRHRRPDIGARGRQQDAARVRARSTRTAASSC